MSDRTPAKKVKGQRARSAPSKDTKARASPLRSPRNIIIAVVVVVVVAVLIWAAWANTSHRGLDIKKGDQLQYVIQSFAGGVNTSGSMIIEVTDTTRTSFKVTYAITLNNNTQRRTVEFTGASGDWRANIADVMNKLSGSSSSATMVNETTYYTMNGNRDLIGYTITTTTQSGVGLFYEYWLDSSTKCPYLASLTYANGDVVTSTLIYTNIAQFQV